MFWKASSLVEKSFTYFYKRSGLVRRDHGDSTQCLDCLLTKNHVLAHQVHSNGQASGQCDRKTFGNEGNGNTDAIYDQSGHVDPFRVILSKPSGPAPKVSNSWG